MKKSTILIIALVVGVFALIGFRLASNKETIDEQKKPVTTVNTTIPVTIATVAEGIVDQQLIKTGTLAPFRQTDITTTTAGKVERVNFNQGSFVKSGATLITLDNNLKEISLEATQLTIDKLKKDVKRYDILLEGNATTQLQVNDVKYNYESALNQAAQLRKQIADANVKAPMSGQIVSRDIEPGEYITPGKVLGTVLDISRLKVEVPVNESDVYKLSKGQAVKVSTELFPGKIFNGSITFISPQGSAEHSYPVEITLNNVGPLKAGTYVNVDFTRKSTQKALQIPRSALVESIQNPYVYIVDGNVARQRKIKVGRELGDKIEVLDGLITGDKVVTTGQVNLTDGKPVNITN